MNFFLTSIFLAICTYGSYWIGTLLSQQTGVAILLGATGFFVGLIMRFFPNTIGELLGAIVDIF